MTEVDPEEFEALVVTSALHLYFLDVAAQSRQALPGAPPEATGLYEEERAALATASDLVKKRSIRERICPGLKSASDDIREMAKIVTAAMLPLALARPATVPLSTLVFGAVAVVIVRAGVQTICAGLAEKKEPAS